MIWVFWIHKGSNALGFSKAYSSMNEGLLGLMALIWPYLDLFFGRASARWTSVWMRVCWSGIFHVAGPRSISPRTPRRISALIAEMLVCQTVPACLGLLLFVLISSFRRSYVELDLSLLLKAIVQAPSNAWNSRYTIFFLFVFAFVPAVLGLPQHFWEALFLGPFRLGVFIFGYA